MRRAAILLGVVTAGGIAVAAFVLSFAALWDIATRVWPSRHLSWLGPVVVDATILQATVSLVAVSSSTRLGERRYFWALLIGAATTSVAGNALHAVVPSNQPLSPWIAAIIATIPPVFLLLSTHSLTLLIRRRPSIDAPIAPSAEAGVGPSATQELDLDVDIDVDEIAGLQHARSPRDYIDAARELRERHGFGTPTAQIAAVLHHRAASPEASMREHAAAGNIHHNTAKKILDAAVDEPAYLGVP
jgi:hypothetical protein